MICANCKEAGHLNADANRAYYPESAKYLRRKAYKLHDQCQGCVCRHKVGDWRNKRSDG